MRAELRSCQENKRLMIRFMQYENGVAGSYNLQRQDILHHGKTTPSENVFFIPAARSLLR
jgi:hypothetical protein